MVKHDKVVKLLRHGILSSFDGWEAREKDSIMFCVKCGKAFARRSAYDKHVRDNVCGAVKCPHCDSIFKRKYNLTRHLKTNHDENGKTFHYCGMCSKVFSSKKHLILHRSRAHKLRTKFRLIASAHNKSCELYRLIMPDELVEFNESLDYAAGKAKKLIKHLVEEKKFMKGAFIMAVRFRQNGIDIEPVSMGAEGIEVITTQLRSKTNTFMRFENADAKIGQMLAQITKSFEDFQQNGSGWVIVDCIKFDVEIGQCLSLSGSGGCEVHQLNCRTKKIVEEKLDPREKEDSRCFYTAIANFFCNQKTGNGGTKSDLEVFIAENICENIQAPVPVSKISQFEKANSHLNMAVNVMYKSEEGDIFPCYASPNINAKNIVNLLLFFNAQVVEKKGKKEKDVVEEVKVDDAIDEGQEAWMHYALIKDLGSLIKPKKMPGATWWSHAKYVCYNCFSTFKRHTAYEAHTRWCHCEKGQRYVLPEEGEKISYNNENKDFKLGYIFFFDFETLQKVPTQACKCDNSSTSECTHKTKVIAEHEAFAYSFLMLNRKGKVVEDLCYVGEDAATHFLSTLLEMDKKYTEEIGKTEPIVMSEEDEIAFQRAEKCHICTGGLGSDKVRDHDHQSGKYIGAAHNICNLHRNEKKKIVGYAHNFSGYDSHIIMNAIAQYKGKLKLAAIPLNTEKFKMLRVNNCVMLDSMAFLNASLEKLVDTLTASNYTFPILRQWMPCEEDMKLLLRKGIYPYEFTTSLDVVNNTRELPPRQEFFSLLQGKTVSEEDYQHALNVWSHFECCSLRDYSTLYVRSDTYQLAEAMHQMRESVLAEFDIDLCHYLSLPMLTKDVMLKSTGVEMELMTDIDMIQFVKSNIRGGLSYVNLRHFDKEEEIEKRGEPISVGYVDANNLYGSAMRFPLPLDEFKWLTEKELNTLTIQDISSSSERGYILEVTLDYPKELHSEHSSFPLAPHHLEISEKMLSPYALNAMQVLTKKSKYKSHKLTSTFSRREKYVCHALNLKLYLEKGLKLVAIHRGISFRQTPFLKPYIDLCTGKRAASKTKSEKDLWKLLINSLYGKVRCVIKTSHSKS